MRSARKGGPAAAVIAFLAAASAATAAEYAFVTTTDYTAGSSSVVWLDGSYTVETGVEPVFSDATARWYQGLIYVVNRLGADNVQVIDPSAGFSTVAQNSVGNGTNPKDIAFVTRRKAFVSRSDTNELLIFDPMSGEILGTVDLSAFADSDGLCEMDCLYLKGEYLFVSVQRVDRDNWWSPVGDSYIAVVDAAADSLVDVDPFTPGVQGIPLAGANPFTELKYDHHLDRLLVSCVGYWGVEDGGIEIVDPFEMESEGFMITEAAAGGDICEFEIFSPRKGYMIVATPSFVTDLVVFDPSAGTAGATLYSPGAWVLNDIEISPFGEIFVADQTETAPGLWIWDAGPDTLIFGSPRSTGLPPFDITFSVPFTSEAGDPPAAAALGRPYPNPFNPATRIPFSIAVDGRVEISVFDVRGARVRTLTDGFLGAGAHETAWDGLNEAGTAVPSGVYFVRMISSGGTSTGKIVLVR